MISLELVPQITQDLDSSYIVETLVKLLRVPTNVPLGENFIAPDDPKLVHYVQEVIKPCLEALGYADLVIDELNNLILRTGRDATGQRMLTMAYTPAQHSNLMREPFSGKIANAKDHGLNELCAFGQGASQNKGALAAMIGVLKLLRDKGIELDGQLLFAINNEGRSSHACSESILNELAVTTDFGILCIGTGNQISLGNRGRVDINITVRGKSSHSSQPWMGLNAIEGVNEIVNRLKTLTFEQEHPSLGRSQLTAYKATFSPVAPHTIPDVGHLSLDRRLLPGEKPDDAVAEIRQAIGVMDPFEVEVERGFYMYPAEVEEDSKYVHYMSEGFQAFEGSPAKTYYPHWTFDAGYLCKNGIPTVMFGPSSTDPAGDDLLGVDFVALAAVELAAKVYAYTILNTLA